MIVALTTLIGWTWEDLTSHVCELWNFVIRAFLHLHDGASTYKSISIKIAIENRRVVIVIQILDLLVFLFGDNHTLALSS